jgi:RES domain-containing protein
MEVFRIARDIFAAQLTASGVAGRWNMDQQYVLYTGSSRSLSTLELVVHRSSIKPSFQYKMMVITISDEAHLFQNITKEDLPANWRTIDAYSALQKIGSQWYTSKASLVLKVPSVVIPNEYNYIINSLHPMFNEHVQLKSLESFYWDERLLE